MALNETTRRMRELLAAISVDIEKAANGNKAASQRVRTGSIRLEKTAKLYRKESISAERSGHWPKKSKKAQHASSKQSSSKNASSKHAGSKLAKSKASQHKQSAHKGHNKATKHATVKARPKAKALHNPHAKNMMVLRQAFRMLWHCGPTLTMGRKVIKQNQNMIPVTRPILQ